MKIGYELKLGQQTYQIDELLGKNDLGIIYKGQDKQTQQIVAIKIQDSINQYEQQMFSKMKGNKFKNLTNLLDFVQIDKKYYTVMEYCNETLFTRIQQKGPINGTDLRFIMKQIGDGIKEIHDLGYCHRNIKPENILIFQIIENGMTQDKYKISDFDILKNASILQTQEIGTAYYHAPEQIDGSNQYFISIDIWAFGALIYELLTGEPMFNGFSECEVWKKIQQTTQEQINEKIAKNLKIQEQYRTLIQNMLQINNNKRYNIQQVLDCLKVQSYTIQKQPSNTAQFCQVGIKIQKNQPINNNVQNNFFINPLTVQQQQDDTIKQRGRVVDDKHKDQKFQFLSPQPVQIYQRIPNNDQLTIQQVCTQKESLSQDKRQFPLFNQQKAQIYIQPNMQDSQNQQISYFQNIYDQKISLNGQINQGQQNPNISQQQQIGQIDQSNSTQKQQQNNKPSFVIQCKDLQFQNQNTIQQQQGKLFNNQANQKINNLQINTFSQNLQQNGVIQKQQNQIPIQKNPNMIQNFLQNQFSKQPKKDDVFPFQGQLNGQAVSFAKKNNYFEIPPKCNEQSEQQNTKQLFFQQTQ